MRAVVTRVKSASVTIDGRVNGEIGQGLLVLLGVGPSDTEAQAVKLADKVCGLRIFEDENEKMNLNLEAVGGALLVVSQWPSPSMRNLWPSAPGGVSGWSTASSAQTCRCTRRTTDR